MTEDGQVSRVGGLLAKPGLSGPRARLSCRCVRLSPQQGAAGKPLLLNLFIPR